MGRGWVFTVQRTQNGAKFEFFVRRLIVAFFSVTLFGVDSYLKESPFFSGLVSRSRGGRRGCGTCCWHTPCRRAGHSSPFHPLRPDLMQHCWPSRPV